MAAKSNVPNELKSVQEGKAVQEEKKMPKQKESAYMAFELADNAAALFGTRKECVLAALKEAGVQSCTLDRAKELVEKFRKKEVK